MKKKGLLFGSAVLLLTLLLAGCGGGAPAATDTETESRQTVTISTLAVESTVSEESTVSSAPADLENKTLEEGNIVVEYPQVRDLGGGDVQKQVNQLIQGDAKACLDEDLRKTEGTGVVENTVIYHGGTASIVSTGTVTEQDGGQTVVVYTTNVDLQTGQRVSTGVREAAAAVAGKILNGEATLLEADSERQAAQQEYLEKLGEKKLTALLQQCDFTEKDKEPKAFSYYMAEDEEEIGVYLPVPAKLGGYALVLLPQGVL